MRLAMDRGTNPRTTLLAASMLVLIFLGFAAGAAEVGPAPAGESSLVHRVKAGDNLIKICGMYREQSNHYSLGDLLSAIRKANGLQTNVLQIGQDLVIPVLPPENAPVVSTRVDQGAELRGMYLTGPACGLGSVWRRVDRFIAAGGNAVVFDAKDIDGGVSFASEHPLATWGKGRSAPVISSLSEMMERLDRREMYVVARVALFLDGELGKQRPDLALADARGEPWSERGCFWMDPRQAEVQEYNLTLARELAAAGVDEIQFDYVRFPTNGWREDFQADERDLETVARERREAITAFLQAARSALEPYDVRISADLYGIMAWGRVEDLALTGQHVPTIATLVDVICPMIYPSHFAPGFEGHRRPGDAPGHFIGEGTRRFRELAAGEAEIRPWLQAFPYRVSRYDGEYIQTQVLAARESGGQGWCLWNPACRYQVAMSVMPGLDQPATMIQPVTAQALVAVAEVDRSPGESEAAPASALQGPATAPRESFLGTMGAAGPAGTRSELPEAPRRP